MDLLGSFTTVAEPMGSLFVEHVLAAHTVSKGALIKKDTIVQGFFNDFEGQKQLLSILDLKPALNKRTETKLKLPV